MATGIVNPYAVAAGGLSYEDECLADSPVGLWMMNETSGTTIVNQGSSGTAGNGSYGTTFSPVLAGDTLFGLTTPDFQNSQDFVLMTYPVGSTPDAGVTGAATWEYLFRIDGSLGAYHFGILPAPYNALMAFSQASGTYSAQILTTYGASPMYVQHFNGNRCFNATGRRLLKNFRNDRHWLDTRRVTRRVCHVCRGPF